MKHRFARYVLLALPLVLAAAASGQTQYYPYDQLTNPTPADLLTYSGVGRSIIVQILNLTPYQITYQPSENYWSGDTLVARLQTDLYRSRPMNRTAHMFAPVGVPEQLPGVPAEYYDPNHPEYSSAPENTVTHPYSMVFAWDDQDHFVEKSSAFWKVEQVPYCKYSEATNNCTPGSGDVMVGLFMSRIAPQAKPVAGFFSIAKGVVDFYLSVFKICMNPANPMAWVSAFSAVKETKDKTVFLANQLAEDEEGKMYVSAYVVPDSTFKCYTENSTRSCQPTTSAQDDATDAGWAYAFAGYPQAELVVLTQVLRGQRAVSAESVSEDKWHMGTVPVVMVTIMKATDYMAAVGNLLAKELTSGTSLAHVQLSPDVRANIEQLKSLLDKHQLSGLNALRAVVEVRNQDDRDVLRGALKSLITGDSLTKAERQALHRLVVDLRLALNKEGKG